MTLRLLYLSWFALLLIGCTAVAPHTLTVVRQPHAEAWTRRLNDTPLRQTFILPYDQSINEIELVLAIPDSAPFLSSRPLTWKIISANQTTLREGVIETAGYPNRTPIRLIFDALPAGESIDLALTAPANADLALWRTLEDRYPQGTLIADTDDFNSDLLFTLRTEETPATLLKAFEGEAVEWYRAAQWLPLILLPLGWLLLWVFGNGEGRPRAAAAAGLSLGAIPILYLWFSLIQLHLYLPLARSLFSIAIALTLFIVIRRWKWLWVAWRDIPVGGVILLGFAILVSIVTWLMAGRDYLAPPGTEMLDSGLLAQQITDTGTVPLPAPPLPPAALTSILSTISQEDVGTLLILSGFVLAVAGVPALFALAEEITEDGKLAVWLLPLAWVWQGPWDAFASGDWFALYSYALMPVAFAMGLRALRVQRGGRRALLLAAVPFATLFLIQGVAALLTWLLTVGTAMVLVLLHQRQKPSDAGISPYSTGEPAIASSIRSLLVRSVAWLFLGFTLLAPTLTQRLPFIGPPDRPLEVLGYGYLVLVIALALGLRVMRRWGTPLIYPAYAVIIVLLLALGWWRSAPLPPTALTLQADEESVLQWMGSRNTPANTQSLINLAVHDGKRTPLDGTFWSPVWNHRPTAYTLPVGEPDLLRRVFEPGALQDALLRDELRRVGITHILLGNTQGPIKPYDLQSQSWVRLAYQSGGAYLFEIVSADPTAQ